MKYNPYSFSRIQTFLNCPRKFFFSYVEKIPKPFLRNEILEKGSVIHLKLEEYYSKRDTSEEVQKYPENIQAVSDEIISRYLKENKIHLNLTKDCEVVGVEEKFGFDESLEICDYSDPNAIFRGSIDLIVRHPSTNTYVLIDHKSSKEKTSRESFDQLSIYAIYVNKKYSPSKIVSFYNYVEYNSSLKKKHSLEDIKKAETQLLENIKKIEIENSFDRKLTPLCNYCNYQDECSSFNKGDYLNG